MKIKKGDNVIIIAGKDKGKDGKIIKAIPTKEQVVIEGLNLKKKHQRARKQGAKGQVVEIAHPIHVSNVMILDPKTKKRTRVGKKLVGKKYIRVAKKSGIELK